MRTSYAKPGFLLKVKKVAKTSSEKSQVKKKPKKLAETSSETFQDPCRRCSASRGYVEKCEASNGFRPPKGRCWSFLFRAFTGPGLAPPRRAVAGIEFL